MHLYLYTASGILLTAQSKKARASTGLSLSGPSPHALSLPPLQYLYTFLLPFLFGGQEGEAALGATSVNVMYRWGDHKRKQATTTEQAGPSRAHIQQLTGVDAIKCSSCCGIPEADTAVSSPASAHQQPMLVGAPRNGLHSRTMIRKSKHWRGCMARVPYIKLIVIPPACQLPIIRRPFQTTHLEHKGYTTS